MNNTIVHRLVEHYQLSAHPEGGYYKEVYRSSEQVAANALPPRFGGSRSFSTSIYFLLYAEVFSAFHRIKSDELWHFYLGAPLHVYVIHPQGHLEVLRLGPGFENGETFQAAVKAGCWFASQCSHANGFSLVGCTVAPGFDFADFEMANANQLAAAYPQHESLIRRLCR